MFFDINLCMHLIVYLFIYQSFFADKVSYIYKVYVALCQKIARPQYMKTWQNEKQNTTHRKPQK